MITTLPELNEFLAAKTKRLEEMKAAKDQDAIDDEAERVRLQELADQHLADAHMYPAAAFVELDPTSEGGAIAIVEMVTTPKAEYERLLKDSDWLACLEAAGVDNWSGFGDAQEMQREAI